MKQIVESESMSEPCLTMNILKIASNNLEGKKESNDETSVDVDFISSSSVKSESCVINNQKDQRKSPLLQRLGPGAEIKGRLCHPIPSCSKKENFETFDESLKPVPVGISGGRLTFFQEGKPLLELSHRIDHGSSWVQVKSKTYWPPSSTTITTATQHPLRQDTPTIHSDDCSSMNSSPWASDHIRKQVGPNIRILVSLEELFYFKSSGLSKALRDKVRLRRNPFFTVIVPVTCSFIDQSASDCNHDSQDIKLSDRKNNLEVKLKRLHENKKSKIDFKLSIYALFEKVDEGSHIPAFVSPRKRYLRSMEGDLDSLSRKKVHSGYKSCDRPSSSSPSFHKSAINHSQNNSSSYSIDSLLSNESDSKKTESFLRNLLKPELQLSRSPKPNIMLRERSHESVSNHHVKHESILSPYLKDHKETEFKRVDLNNVDLPRYSSHMPPHLKNMYFNPYHLDPCYMMLHPFLQQSHTQPNDVAIAVAAAAAAGYPFSTLQMTALAAGNPLLNVGLSSSLVASGSSAQHVQTTNTTSNRGLSMPQSPKPPILHQHFTHAVSPRENLWSPSSFNSNSPQKLPNENALSPPPQDAPLNLSKQKGKS